MHMRQIIKDLKTWDFYLENGYAILSGVNDETIETSEKLFSDHFNVNHQGIFVSNHDSDFELNNTINNQVQSLYKNWIKDNFVDFKFIISHFISKSNANSTLFDLHQDWSVVNENDYCVVHLWVPFQETTKENGCMYLLPKSNHFFNNYRSGSIPIPIVRDLDLLKNKLVTVALKKGEALLFHPAIFHGSFPNLSNKPRRNALIALTDENATLKYFHRNEDNSLDEYYITRDDLLNDLPLLAKGLISENVGKRTKKLGEMHTIDNAAINEAMLLKFTNNER